MGTADSSLPDLFSDPLLAAMGNSHPAKKLQVGGFLTIRQFTQNPLMYEVITSHTIPALIQVLQCMQVSPDPEQSGSRFAKVFADSGTVLASGSLRALQSGSFLCCLFTTLRHVEGN